MLIRSVKSRQRNERVKLLHQLKKSFVTIVLLFGFFFITGGLQVHAENSLSLLMTGQGTYVHENYGISGTCAGDINGDGVADVIVGAPQNDHTAVNAGAVYIYWGGAHLSLDDTPDLVLYSIWLFGEQRR